MFINIKLNKRLAFSFVAFLIFLTFFCNLHKFENIIHANVYKINNISVPVIMYHGILRDEALQGEYVISPSDFEEDLIYLKENGYNTITMQNLIDYVHNEKELPEKPVVLTFDDGYYNNYLYAFPLAVEYNAKIVLSPIVSFTEFYSNTNDFGASYAMCRWSELKEMADSGYVEIQNHTYDMHYSSGARMGLSKSGGESEFEYKKAISTDIETAQNRFYEELGITPNTIAYPFGFFSSETAEIAKELGFKATLTCEERSNIISNDTECLYNMGRFLRSNKKTAEDILTAIPLLPN